MERIMNQDVQNLEESSGSVLSDRLVWDWHNPLNALPLATIGVLVVSGMIMLLKLLSS
jgi:hypothetical protein